MAEAEHQRIAALEAELAALRAEMQDFSYTVSHDLRASLRHVLSYVQLVQEDAGALLPQETLGFLNTVSESARHMGLLMDGLMELSRLGTVAVHLEPVPLQPLLQDVLALLALREPGPAVDWHLQAHLPVVLADAALLRTALLCVLDNALKFSSTQAAPRIEISARLDTSGAEAKVVLSVQDNGVGYNPALGAKLFHPFQRLHTAKQFPGLGMGLALTRKIAQRLGAQVQAVGAVDAGCTVCLTLPAAPASP
jgi:light-regulated signal transduction histidine kinase (bacteriophytochrome)